MIGVAAGWGACVTSPIEGTVLIAALKKLLFARQAARVRAADAKLRTLFELAPGAMAILDSEYRYESVNPAYCALTGYLSEELIGKQANISGGAGTDALSVKVRPHLERCSRWEGQLSLQHKDGSVVEVECKIAQAGVSGTHILVATDLGQWLQMESERRRLLASERAARSEVERSNRLRDEFLETLSHELRNPLNAILGWATVLSRSVALPADVLQGIRAIERNSKLQAQMIADMFDYAGIYFGRAQLVVETVDPYPIVQAALDEVHSAALAQGVHIQAAFGAGPVRVEANSLLLQQAALNLLSNAIKFSRQGGTVSVSAARVDDSFRFVVQDNGVGIAPDFLPHVFERSGEHEAAGARSQGGVRFGLAIVKRVVELHGGSIEVFSAGEERGAAFTVNLPLSDGEASATVAAASDLRHAV